MNSHPPPQDLSYEPGFQPPPNNDRGAVIRNIESGLVLDASDYEVKVQEFTGAPSQLWNLEPVGDGKFMIINQGNGAALDVEGGVELGANIITYEKHGGENQQWYVKTDRTIVSAVEELALDIFEGNLVPGNTVIAYEKHGDVNQQFNIEYQ